MVFFDKAPTGIPSSGSPDTWVLIGAAVVVGIAIIIGIVAVSKKGKRGAYWCDEDAWSPARAKSLLTSPR